MPYWDFDEEPWRAWMPPGREPQPEPQTPQWDLGSLFGPARRTLQRGWEGYGWLGRLLQPIQQFAYAQERGMGATEERAPARLARGFAQAADLTKWLPTQWGAQMGARVGQQLFGGEPRPTAQENVALHLQAKEGYFDYVKPLPLETKQIVNRETRRIHYSGYERRQAAAQEIVEGGDYSPEAITEVLKKHEDWKAELIGQVIFDPLNFAGVVLKPLGLTKAGRQALVGRRATEALGALPELGRIDALRDSLLMPLSKSLDDQGAFMLYLHNAATRSDEAGELIARLQRLKNPDELTRIFADVADKERIFLSETSRRKFLRHLDNIDLDAIEVGEKGVSQIVDEVAEMLPGVTDAFHGVGPVRAFPEGFSRRVKSIIGIPLIGMNLRVASKNIINAAVTGVWDEGAMPLAETLRALPSRGDSIRNFFIKEGLDPKHIERWVFRGFGDVPETGKATGLIGKIAVPGRIMRFMERFQSAATFKGGYLKTWDALYGGIVPQLTPEIIQQLGPHGDDFASLIRHSNPGNVQDKVTAFMKAVEAPEAVAKPLASYVDQLPQGIAQHWEEMLAPWVKEGLEIEGKSLNEALEMLRAAGARVDADVVAKVAADAPEAAEVAGFGDDLFDADGWLRGRDRMWPEVQVKELGEMVPRRQPPFDVDERTFPLFDGIVREVEQILGVTTKQSKRWVDEAARFGYTEGGAFVTREELKGVLRWGGLHDKGRLHYWKRMMEWAVGQGEAETLAEMGLRVIEPEDLARALIPEDLLSKAAGATETPSLSKLAQVQQKAARSIFEQLEQIITADFQKPRGVAADVMPFIDNEVLPAMRDAQTGSLMVADLIRNDVMLNYTRRMRFDPWVDLVFPYHFWFDRSMGNWLRRIMASPAKAATYAKLRSHIIEKDRDLPSRLQGTLPLAVDNILPNWAVNMIFLNPEKALIPFPSIFQEKPYERPAEKLTPLGRGMEWMQNVLPMAPSPLVHYPLALSGALGEPSQWVSGPQTPTGREIRAASATGWGRELGERMGYEVPPTGINIEAPLLRMAGIEEVPHWEKEYWPLKHIALMAEQGEITQDEAVEAMRSKSGPLWEEAQRRTTYQKAWPTLTGMTGFPAKIRAAGEPEVEAAREAQEAAPSYERFRSYYERHPGIGLTNLAWKMAGGEGFEEQAKEWLQWYDYRQYKADRDSAIDEYIRENPGDTKGLGELAQLLGANRPAIPDKDFQRHLSMTDEEYQDALSGNLIWRVQEFKPDYDDFEQFGYGQYDAWQAAVQEFYNQTETGEAPWMQELIQEAMGAMGGLSEEDARAYVVSLIGGQEGIEKHFRQYDSILEAAQRVYKDSYIDGAYEARDQAYAPWGAWKDAERAAGFDPDSINALWDQYHTLPERTGQRSAFLKEYPELLEHLEFKDEYQEEHPEAIWENVEAQVQAVERAFGSVDATRFIPEILERYKERGWTEGELREALGVSAGPALELWPFEGATGGVLSFLQAGKASHPDEVGPPEEYDAMIRAVRTGQGIPEAIAIAQSHLNAHRNAFGPGRDTVRDPYPGEPEKNEASARGFEAVIDALQGYGQLGTLTFPGFAPYREMRQRDAATVQRETPTAPGAAVAPAAGRAVAPQAQYAPQYQPRVPQWAIGKWGGGTYMPTSRGWGGGGGGFRGSQQSPWWDWGPLEERFTWRT